MIDFIAAYWMEILLVLAVAALVVFFAVKGKKQIIYKMLCMLIDEAENMYGSKTGKLKFAYVLENIYTMLPAIFRMFITYSTLERWIENALVEMKEYWEEQAKIAE